MPKTKKHSKPISFRLQPLTIAYLRRFADVGMARSHVIDKAVESFASLHLKALEKTSRNSGNGA